MNHVEKMALEVLYYLVMLALAFVFPKTVILLACMWAWSSYQTWEAHFAGRVGRSHPQSPSYPKPPLLAKASASRSPRSATATGAEAKVGREERDLSLDNIDNSQQCEANENEIGGDAKEPPLPQNEGGTGGGAGKGGGGKVHAPRLDMNHIRLTFLQYLWGAFLIQLPAFALMAYGISKIMLLKLARRLGFLKSPSEHEVRRLAARLLLETDLVINYTHSDRLKKEAFMELPSLPVFSGPEQSVTTIHLAVRIDLQTKAVVEAHVGGDPVSASDLVLLLVHAFLFVSHPQLHAFANWGIDPACDGVSGMEAYCRKMSVATTLYNHFGLKGAPQILAKLCGDQKVGLAVSKVFELALEQTPPAHAHVRELLRHSRLVRFLTYLRPGFFRAFHAHREEFPGNVDPEAYFLNSVVHGLDHSLFEEALPLETIMALEIAPEFQGMESCAIFCLACLTPDLPGIIFSHYFHQAPTAFHARVYQIAYKIDPKLAGLIETCIIK